MKDEQTDKVEVKIRQICGYLQQNIVSKEPEKRETEAGEIEDTDKEKGKKKNSEKRSHSSSRSRLVL